MLGLVAYTGAGARFPDDRVSTARISLHSLRQTLLSAPLQLALPTPHSRVTSARPINVSPKSRWALLDAYHPAASVFSALEPRRRRKLYACRSRHAVRQNEPLVLYYRFYRKRVYSRPPKTGSCGMPPSEIRAQAGGLPRVFLPPLERAGLMQVYLINSNVRRSLCTLATVWRRSITAIAPQGLFVRPGGRVFSARVCRALSTNSTSRARRVRWCSSEAATQTGERVRHSVAQGTRRHEAHLVHGVANRDVKTSADLRLVARRVRRVTQGIDSYMWHYMIALTLLVPVL